MATTDERPVVPPQNLEAEESILGAMLLSPTAIESVQEHVSPEDFYRPSHGLIFKTCVDMHDRELPVDVITVTDELERLGAIENVGGRTMIHQLAALMPATSNASHYAKIVREQAVRRGLTRAGQEIAKLGSGDVAGDLDELLHKAEESLSRVALATSGSATVSIDDAFDEYVAEVRHAYTTGERITGLLTDFLPLDDILVGLWPEQLILIAARPSQGKSALALNIAENVVDAGETAWFVSLEMSLQELQERSLSRAAKVDSYNLRSGKLETFEVERLGPGIAKVKERKDKLLIHHSGSMTLSEFKAEATRLRRTKDISLIVIDYLQLMTPPKAETQNLAIGEISRSLKLLAKRLGIPIIALSQMSRAIESRGGVDRRPQLSDLRDSGSLEQDADVVMFLHDPSAYDLDKEPDGTVEVHIAKNRKGRKDTAKLAFIRKHSRFIETDPRKDDT